MKRILNWLKTAWKPPHIVWQKQLSDGSVIISVNQPVWLWLIFALSIAYAFAQTEVIVIPLFTLGVCIWSCWGWAQQMAENLQAQRKLRFSAKQVGDEIEENFTLWNSSVLPVLWASLEDRSDFPNYAIQSVRWVGSRNKSEWRHSQICTQRGVFTLGPWAILSSDPFGIFSVQREYSAAQQMVVYPPLASIRSDLLPYGKQQGDLRPLNQPLIAESILSTHARQYQPGDPLARIHWRTSARKNKLHVKVFDPEAASRIWLIPDLDPNVHVGKGLYSSEETLILLLAALAAQLLDQQRAVGLYAATNPACIVMPQRGTAHLWTILSALAPLHTTQKTPFSQSLLQASGLISSQDLVIAATPSTDQLWLRSLAQLTHGQHGSEAWAYMLDCESMGGATPSLSNVEVAASLGMVARIIRSEDIRTILGSYGAIRRWEFITTGTGKVVLANAPRQAETGMSYREGLR
ncbi:MAG: DUF58 domain-containing protein [Anaerolineaceae bacterium]|nr:DUF58 domain-containing protein [Anaerolineaceae bacterium]